MMDFYSEKNRIGTMIDALRRTLAGDDSAHLNVSPKNDERDTLAKIINELLKKTGKPFAPRQQKTFHLLRPTKDPRIARCALAYLNPNGGCKRVINEYPV